MQDATNRTATHTPTPVQVEEYQVPLGAGHYHVIGSATNEIAYCSRHLDAVHIVRCVNEREGLLAALRGADQFLNYRRAYLSQEVEVLRQQVALILAQAERVGEEKK